ncbi:outer membrane lipoprotein chaperone LolA [bacterium]|nr:outer membrane lipoprotein chaperone LolA [bacterium]
MKRTVFAALVAALPLVFAAPAGAQTIDEIAEKVRSAYASMKDFRADFIQETTSARGTQGASGTIKIKLPARMRWDYAEPTNKQLLTDGLTSWMYLPDEKQVYVQPLSGSANAKIPLEMLTGRVDFREEYNARLAGDADGVVTVELLPKTETAGFDRATLWIDKSTWRISKFTITDPYGAKTTVILKNAAVNPGLADSEFTWTDKPGVEIVRAPGS